MKTEYKRDLNHNYLIIEEEEEINTASYQVRMLAGNVIPSLLRCHLQNLDGKNIFYYEITSKQSVASFYDGKKIGTEEIRMLLGGFICIMEEMAEYLMNPQQLLLLPEYVYLDIESGKVFFCCLPGTGREVQAQFRELMEYILPKIAHEDQEAVLLGYGVYRKMLEPGFQLEVIKEAVYQTGRENLKEEEEKTEKMKAEKEQILSDFPLPEKTEKKISEDDQKKKSSGWWWAAGCGAGVLVMLGILGLSLAGIFPWIPAELIFGCGIAAFGMGGFIMWTAEEKNKKRDQKAEWRQKIGKGAENNENGSEKTEIPQENHYVEMENSQASQDGWESLGEDGAKGDPNVWNEAYGETVALSAGKSSGPASLVSREPGELATIYLEQEITVVGKLFNAADAVIQVPTVSRVHARIRKKEGAYYLADMNSRNGTMVNGQLLKSGEEYQLHDEDEVDFAQARYIFLE